MNELFRSAAQGRFGRKVKHERGAKIPVTLLTGFLGAGKTTLLQHFLRTPEGAGTAVVVNEFGAVGIDDALLRTSSDETVLLGNGCVCCTTRTDLQNALRSLVIERDRGVIPDFRRVVIETSGLADPGPILQTFATDRALGDLFHVELMAVVVDAATGLATLDRAPEARKQVILGDLLIISKADLCDAKALAAMEQRIRALNSRAAIVTAQHGVIDPQRLLESTVERTAFVAEAEHSDLVRSFVVADDEPIRWPIFARTMETLAALRGPDLLRVKGFLDVEGCTGPVLVQFVQHLAHPPVELTAWPDGKRGSRLVFITRNLPEAQVRGLFAAVKALGG